MTTTKTFHFLAGLPRSGNTLLSAILNQNPGIYSSPISPVAGLMWQTSNNVYQTESVQRSDKNKHRIDFFLKSFIENFYFDVEQPIVVDREKAWATPGNFEMLKKHVKDQPKIIFTVRPILEILASFIAILPEHSYIDREMEQAGWWSKDYLTKDDNRCDYLMSPFGLINKSMLSANVILKPENAKNFCVVSYDEIVSNSKATMSKIYEFLDLPDFDHDFDNVVKLENDDDSVLGQPNDFHTIRPKVGKTSNPPKSLLSDYVINKYSNTEWWTK
jgi:sulfotransferase